MIWPFKKKTPVAVEKRIQVEQRQRSKLTLSEYRSDLNLVAGASAMLQGDYARLIIEVLRNSSPAHDVLHPFAPMEARAARQAMIEGYELCIRNLESTAVYSSIPEVASEKFVDEEPSESELEEFKKQYNKK